MANEEFRMSELMVVRSSDRKEKSISFNLLIIFKRL